MTCRHKPDGYVLIGSFDGAHVSRACCSRPTCVDNVIRILRKKMDGPAEFHEFSR